MTNNAKITIRPLSTTDREQWARLWQDYLTFYQTTLPDQVYDTTFSRLLGDDPQDFSCLLACDGDRPVGLVHFLFHRHAWKIENVCYLQDLFADPQVRGRGIGRALINAVYAAADQKDAPSVYWMTQDSNATARQLYDRIGVHTPFIKYARP
jgi:GNAT superfamily N-acetyltransferase